MSHTVRTTAKTALAVIVVVLAAAGLLLHADVPHVASNTWAPAGDMTSVRAGASGTLLANGLVLIAGGIDGNGATASVERFSPDGAHFIDATSMQSPRANHTATLLADGRVLVAGGTDASGAAGATAEIYDSTANVWLPAGSLNVARRGHTATRLPDGKVLIAGGDDAGVAIDSLEVFDPETALFTVVDGASSGARTLHAAAALLDGRVLITGGFDGTNPLASTSIYDPESNTVSAGPDLSTPRSGLTATTLLDGRVLVTGGAGASGELASAEIFDPATNAFTATDNSLASARQNHLAFLLPHNNQVLILGGLAGGNPVAAAEYFTPWEGTNGVFCAQAICASGYVGPMQPASARAWATGSALSFAADKTIRTGPNDGLLVLAGGSDQKSSELFGFATVKTDKDDYAPGTTVTITGGGWQPGETVALMLVESPLLDTHPLLSVTADGSGIIGSTEFVPDQHDVGVRFYLTAFGTVSQAQTSFTDAISTTTTIASNVNPSTFGESVTFTGTVTCASSCTFGTETVDFVENTNSNCSTGTVLSSANPLTITNNGTSSASATATFITSSFSVGSHSIRACFNGTPGGGPTSLSKSSSSPLTQTVNKATPTLSVTNSPITYSGAAQTATVVGSVAGAVTNVRYNGSATVPTNAGTYAITADFAPTDTTDYNSQTGAAAGNFVIAPALVTANIIGNPTKPYDVNANATFTSANFSLTGLVGAQSFTVTKTTGTYNSANVATASTVSTTLVAGDFTPGGGTLASNYALPTSASGPGHITAKAVSASIIGDPTKPYDGNANATLTSGNFGLTGLVGVESFTVTKTTGTYNSANVATANTVSTTLVAGNFTPGGGAVASNYSLPTTASGAGHITAKVVTASIIGDPTKPYDGNANATLTSGNFGLTGLVGAESFTVTKTTGTYNSTNVATANTVSTTLVAGDFTPGDGAVASNYSLPTTASGPGHITGKAVTASIIGDPTKPYDGNANATLTSGNFGLSGLVGVESFTVTKTTGTYNSTDVATANTVSTTLVAGDFTPGGGAVASNYSLPTTASGAGHITAKVVTASIIGDPTKPYDGNANATLTSGNFGLSGLVGVESFTVTKTTGTYNSTNVATANTVSTTLVAGDFTPGGGAVASNYVLPTTASGAGHITAVTLTATIIGDPTKPYDSNTSATLMPANFSLSGLVGTEGLTVTQTVGTYNSKDVPTANSITASLGAGDFTPVGLTLAGNYVLPTTASGAGHITAVTLTATIIGNPTKPYDSNTSAPLTSANFSLSGLVGTESLTVTQTVGTYNSKDVATANSITASLGAGDFTPVGLTLAGNYVLPTTASGAGYITAVTLTASITGNPTKPYDGNTTATLTNGNFALTPLVGSENFTVTKTAGTYNSKDVATANTVTASLSAGDFTPTGGAIATNYVVPTTASGAGHITAATLTASIMGDPTRPYNGNMTATLAPANFSLSGLVGAESFTVTQTVGTYNNKDVATANTVTASLSAGDFTPTGGAIATNYVVPTTASGAGHITAATLTASIMGDPTRPYNGNMTATLAPANFSLLGLVGSESFTVTQTVGTYNSKDVATANSITASLGAGDFTPVGLTLAGNYVLPTTATGAGHITVATSAVTVDCTAGAPHTYTGLAQTPCTAEATGVGMSPVDVTGSLTYSNNVSVGPATANASWAGDANHTGNTGSGGFNITVATSMVTVDCTAGAPHTYTGLAQTPCTAQATGAGMSPVNLTGSLTYSSNVTVGPATANASWAGDANHTGNTGSGGFNITVATSMVTVDCTAGAPHTFTGLAQTPCTAQATGAGMSPVNLTGSLTYSSNVTVGPATANASWAGDANHTGNAGSGGFNITPASSTTTFGPAPTPTFPGAPFAVSASNNSTGAITYTYVSGPCSGPSGATFTPTGVGLCTVRADSAATTNYLASFATQDVTITGPLVTTGTLIVVKHVINDNGGTALAGNFWLSVGNNGASPSAFWGSEAGTSVTLPIGASYNVTESGPRARHRHHMGDNDSDDDHDGFNDHDHDGPRPRRLHHAGDGDRDDDHDGYCDDFHSHDHDGGDDHDGNHDGHDDHGDDHDGHHDGDHDDDDDNPVIYMGSFAGCFGTIHSGTQTCTITNDDFRFVTYTQGSWGATPKGNNAGNLLAANFGTVYSASYPQIGSGSRIVTFTTALAIKNFLPAGGNPNKLLASATNPGSTNAGVFAGQVLALSLNVDFSHKGIIQTGLEMLKVAPGNKLAGQTVLQVLAAANTALGGGALPSNTSLAQLNDLVTDINEAFDSGKSNHGVLIP